MIPCDSGGYDDRETHEGHDFRAKIVRFRLLGSNPIEEL
jgi:hypothetical protein